MSNFMRKRRQGGFTLIELMIVVAIVAILALLAVFGVSKFLANAKTAEATNALGAINKNAIAAYERESGVSELLSAGATSASNVHQLCGTSTQVPANISSVKNKKYQPATSGGIDYDTGNTTVGWKCLKFTMNEPQYFSYMYTKGGRTALAGASGNTANSLAVTATMWTAAAGGDTNGDGQTSLFETGGNAVNGQVTAYTQIYTDKPEE